MICQFKEHQTTSHPKNLDVKKQMNIIVKNSHNIVRAMISVEIEYGTYTM